jgi:hypothetical protein
LQRTFYENFAGIITHSITHAELKGLKQKGVKSLRDYYCRFGELRAQIHDITEQEVIEAFSNGSWPSGSFKTFAKRTREIMKSLDAQ